ncbi:MAG: glycosyltransferase family 4 protein [Patescibacteria group bacterium]
MKLFFFITKSEAGGAQTHVAQLTKFFVERGDDVAIMSAPGGWLETEVRRLGARFFPNHSLSNSVNPLRVLKAASTLSKAIQEFQPDLFACHSTVAGLLGRFVIRNRIPTVFTAHGWGFQSGAPLPRRILLPMIERLAAQFCAKIICVSQNDLALARRHRIAPPEKLIQIYNGVEMTPEELMGSLRSSSDSSVPPSSRLRRAGGMTQEENINIFFVGRLAPPKDPFLLISAVSSLPQALQDLVRVTIIGDGPQMAALQDIVHESHLESQVSLLGALPREEVLRRLKDDADLFVLISHWEGFPYSIIEAMACGVPVIASDVGGVREAVTPETGILLAHNDVQTLANALQQLIEDPQRRRVMGGRASVTAQNKFSVEMMCKSTDAIYQSLI